MRAARRDISPPRSDLPGQLPRKGLMRQVVELWMGRMEAPAAFRWLARGPEKSPTSDMSIRHLIEGYPGTLRVSVPAPSIPRLGRRDRVYGSLDVPPEIHPSIYVAHAPTLGLTPFKPNVVPVPSVAIGHAARHPATIHIHRKGGQRAARTPRAQIDYAVYGEDQDDGF